MRMLVGHLLRPFLRSGNDGQLAVRSFPVVERGTHLVERGSSTARNDRLSSVLLLTRNTLVYDNWVYVGNEGILPISGDIVAPLERLRSEWKILRKSAHRVGLICADPVSVEILHSYLPHLALVILPFHGSDNDRLYSTARQIRAFGYQNELRAIGDLRPEQSQPLRQAGFDTLEISENFALSAWLAEPSSFQKKDSTHDKSACLFEAQPWAEQPYAG